MLRLKWVTVQDNQGIVYSPKIEKNKQDNKQGSTGASRDRSKKIGKEESMTNHMNRAAVRLNLLLWEFVWIYNAKYFVY
jgi:hypothetical protein